MNFSFIRPFELMAILELEIWQLPLPWRQLWTIQHRGTYLGRHLNVNTSANNLPRYLGATTAVLYICNLLIMNQLISKPKILSPSDIDS